METINSYPSWEIQAKQMVQYLISFAGYSIYIKYPDGTTLELCDIYGENCSTHGPETTELRTTIELLYKQFNLVEPKPCFAIIFIHVMSVSETLKNIPYE